MDDRSEHINRIDGSASAHSVVQAKDVRGGVHFHQHPHAALAVVPRQLRSDIRHFINRSPELTRLATLIADDRVEPHAARVAVITGTAGVGKTSLAIHWAHTVRPHFPDGELYANLRGYAAAAPASPEEVLGRFLEDLGVPAAQVPPGRERRETLFRSLTADRRVLMFLDNAAHGAQVLPLLPGTAASLVLVTSRDDLTSLVAQHGALRVEVATLSATDAVALLRATTADYRESDRCADLAELARLCAGLPLALRIAAERAAGWAAMSLDELINELRNESTRWNVLTADAEEGPDAMRSVFEWSYQALPSEAARVFRLLGLHPGNEFGLAAVASLTGAEPARVRGLLETLVRAHLLERRPGGRYEFHDLLRDYAAELMRRETSEAERSEIRARCLSWYLHTADAAQRAISPHDRWVLDDHVPPPPATLAFDGYEPAFQWYRTESANLVTATRVAAEAGLPGIAWRLAVVLRAIYMHHNAFDAWDTTARIAINAARQSQEQAGEAEALENLGKVAFQALRLEEAEDCHQAALAIRRQLGDRHGTAVSINALGLLALRRRRLDEAEAHFTQSADIFLELGERRWTALMRSNLAETLCELGRGPEAGQIIEQALADFRELGDHFGEGNALFLLSWARRESGDPEAAAHAISDALSIADAEDNQLWQGHWLAESARVELARGDPEAALRLSQESAAVQRRLGDTAREAHALDLAGEACQSLGRFDEAAQLHRRAIAVYHDLDAHCPLAHAVAHLASALDALGEHVPARAARDEVLILLAEFHDPQARALAQRVAAHLSDGG
jgi:tetratricopeptide (TPR) repeat protein